MSLIMPCLILVGFEDKTSFKGCGVVTPCFFFFVKIS